LGLGDPGPASSAWRQAIRRRHRCCSSLADPRASGGASGTPPCNSSLLDRCKSGPRGGRRRCGADGASCWPLSAEMRGGRVAACRCCLRVLAGGGSAGGAGSMPHGTASRLARLRGVEASELQPATAFAAPVAPVAPTGVGGQWDHVLSSSSAPSPASAASDPRGRGVSRGTGRGGW
jgi:hypothetical protein